MPPKTIGTIQICKKLSLAHLKYVTNLTLQVLINILPDYSIKQSTGYVFEVLSSTSDR